MSNEDDLQKIAHLHFYKKTPSRPGATVFQACGRSLCLPYESRTKCMKTTLVRGVQFCRTHLKTMENAERGGLPTWGCFTVTHTHTHPAARTVLLVLSAFHVPQETPPLPLALRALPSSLTRFLYLSKVALLMTFLRTLR